MARSDSLLRRPPTTVGKQASFRRRRPTPLGAPSLLHDERGATAVEFGLVALPFFALLATIIQVAFTIWAQQNLDFVLQRTVRSMFTGQFQAANSGTTDSATLLTALKTSMCGPNNAPTVVLFDCSSIKIDVTLGTNSGTTFAGSIVSPPVDPTTKNWSAGFGTHYSCAAPGAIVITTAAVKFPVFFNLLTASFMDFSDGSALLQSTAVFRTEPYGTQANGTPTC